MSDRQGYCSPPRSARECKYWWFDCWDWLINASIRLAGRVPIEQGPGRIAIDLHLHTLFSHCSISRPDRVLSRAAALGLGGVGVMDHHKVKGALDTIRCADDMKSRGVLPDGFLVIPGVELNSDVGHIGALFVTEDLPEGLSPAETVNAIHAAGGLAVAVHPYHSTGIGDAVFDAPFDAVEVECGSVFDRKLVEANRALMADQRVSRVSKIGTSDAHYLNAIASCYTLLDLDQPTLASARESLISCRSSAQCSPPLERMRKLLGLIPKLR